MLILLVFVMFILIVAGTWFSGLWSNFITLINVILAATIASGFYGAVAQQFDNFIDPETGNRFAGQFKNYTYLLDFLALWGLFFICYGFLRLATDIMSKHRMKFNIWVEMAGRSVLSIWIAWTFICFSLFTLHTAPLPLDAFGGQFQATPTSRNFIGIGPDRFWLAYLQSRSRGAFARSTIDETALHADDVGKNLQPFDSKGEFIYKYRHRREVFAEQEGTLVQRAW